MTAPSDFKPIFQRVAQDDRHSDILAVLASLSNSTLAQIRQQAEVFGVPQVGPYHSYTTDGDLIAKVAMSRGLVATNWRESKSFTDLDPVSLALVAYDEDWQIGRAVLFHRLPADHPSKVAHYVLDPYPHADSKLHVRTDCSGLVPRWFIGFTQAAQPKVKGSK